MKIKKLEWKKTKEGFIAKGPFGTFEAKEEEDGFIGEYYTENFNTYESEGADSIPGAKAFCQYLLRKQLRPCLRFIFGEGKPGDKKTINITWHPVSEKPKKDGRYLCNPKEPFIARYFICENCWIGDEDSCYRYPKFWTELPTMEVPNESTI